MEIVREARPAQATLVPDAPGQLTSSAGWDVIANMDFLSGIVSRLKEWGVRVSIFVAAEPEQIEAAARAGADRVELYTKPYADVYGEDPAKAVAPFVVAARTAAQCGLGLNAGHDLNLRNLAFFADSIPNLDEVSIGHAIISDALYLGIDATIKAYLDCLKKH